MGVTGVWWAQPVADALCFAFTLVFVARELRRLNALKTTDAPRDAADKEGAVA